MNEESRKTPFYIHVLKEGLLKRQQRSASYSLRAYARDLGVHAATLSMVFTGKRSLSHDVAVFVAEKLNLSLVERTKFFVSLREGRSMLDEIKIDAKDDDFVLDESYYHVIAEWEHFALLESFDCSGFVPELSFIGRWLGIPPERLEVVVENLVTSGLLKRTASGFERIHGGLKTTEDLMSKALRAGHRETLEMGKDKLDEIDVELRDFSSIMLAFDSRKIPEAKTIIREFRKKMEALMKSGDPREVYQLAIQLYPMTTASGDNK